MNFQGILIFTFVVLLTGCQEYFEGAVRNKRNNPIDSFGEGLTCDNVRAGIVGGIQANENTFSNIVKIHNYITSAPNCSGVLIAPNVVLTAGHCFVNNEVDMREIPNAENSYVVSAGVGSDCGSHNNSISKQVEKIIIHESLEQDSFDGIGINEHRPHVKDMAIVILREGFDLNYMMPTLTNFDDLRTLFRSGVRELNLVGFGRRGSEANAVLGSRHRVEVELGTFTGHEFTTNQRVGTGACRGDSGGGVVGKITSNGGDLWHSIGIISRGPELCGAGITETHTLIYDSICWAQEKLNSENLEINLDDNERHCQREELIQEVCSERIENCHLVVSQKVFEDSNLLNCVNEGSLEDKRACLSL